MDGTGGLSLSEIMERVTVLGDGGRRTPMTEVYWMMYPVMPLPLFVWLSRRSSSPE
jgi:hypothetical protein